MPLSPEDLRKTATHVVTGRVVAVFVRTTTGPEWKTTHCVAEVRIAECEKGDGLRKGDLVYARYWHRVWVGQQQMPPSTIGHRGRPAEGASVRIYLAKNAYDGFGTTSDGGYTVIGANGFEAPPPAPVK